MKARSVSLYWTIISPLGVIAVEAHHHVLGPEPHHRELVLDELWHADVEEDLLELHPASRGTPAARAGAGRGGEPVSVSCRSSTSAIMPCTVRSSAPSTSNTSDAAAPSTCSIGSSAPSLHTTSMSNEKSWPMASLPCTRAPGGGRRRNRWSRAAGSAPAVPGPGARPSPLEALPSARRARRAQHGSPLRRARGTAGDRAPLGRPGTAGSSRGPPALAPGRNGGSFPRPSGARPRRRWRHLARPSGARSRRRIEELSVVRRRRWRGILHGPGRLLRALGARRTRDRLAARGPCVRGLADARGGGCRGHRHGAGRAVRRRGRGLTARRSARRAGTARCTSGVPSALGSSSRLLRGSPGTVPDAGGTHGYARG